MAMRMFLLRKFGFAFTGWALKNGPLTMQEKVGFPKFTTLYGISSHQTKLF